MFAPKADFFFFFKVTAVVEYLSADLASCSVEASPALRWRSLHQNVKTQSRGLDVS